MWKMAAGAPAAARAAAAVTRARGARGARGAAARGAAALRPVFTYRRASNQNCSMLRVPRKLPSDVCTFSAVDE